MNEPNPYRDFCAQRRAESQLRSLVETRIVAQGRAERDGVTYLNFASNDYLGLSQHPALIARAVDYAQKYGVGATASRLITGNTPLYTHIEQRLAAGKGTEAALILQGGYATNLTVLAALADAEVLGKPVTVLADRLAHHSLLQGAKLGSARLMRFRHNDAAHLEALLKAQRATDSHIIIVTESVFGMDGDCADLVALTALARRYGAMLYVDEAHATGLFGRDGFGFCADYPVDVAMGTFGKALGGFGAYIACSSALRDYLIQKCGSLVYSTALPPSVLGAIETTLEILPTMQAERAHLHTQTARLREALHAQGWNCGTSTTQIVPVLLGGEETALKLAEVLRAEGILAPAIRPPTVPRGTSRVRLSLSAAHSAADIDGLIVAMECLAPHFRTAA